jgi:hypothetical protein
MKKAEFIDYVLSFYAPGQIYGDFFENSLTQEEVNRAVNLRIKKTDEIPFDGDSVDREIVRDIILALRGKSDLEHDVRKFLK